MNALSSVSVIVPTHNRAATVARAVRSVLSQSYQELEVIVVDDGSTDETPEVVASFADPRLRYIVHATKRGGGAARNTGIDVASGEYIAFLDADDEWLPDKLEDQIAAIQRVDPSVAAIYTGFAVVDAAGRVAAVRLPRHRGSILSELWCANVVRTVSTVVVRRTALQRVGGFDPTLPSCQDWDLWLRLAKVHQFDFLPRVLVHYNAASAGRITTDTRAVVDGHVRIAEKYLQEAHDFPARDRARHLFALGRRLIQLGYALDAVRAKRMGRALLLRAIRTRPAALWMLLPSPSLIPGLLLESWGLGQPNE
jgi:glycosyltransferase involved in cell wall biosynthesis